MGVDWTTHRSTKLSQTWQHQITAVWLTSSTMIAWQKIASISTDKAQKDHGARHLTTHHVVRFVVSLTSQWTLASILTGLVTRQMMQVCLALSRLRDFRCLQIKQPIQFQLWQLYRQCQMTACRTRCLPQACQVQVRNNSNPAKTAIALLRITQWCHLFLAHAYHAKVLHRI